MSAEPSPLLELSCQEFHTRRRERVLPKAVLKVAYQSSSLQAEHGLFLGVTENISVAEKQRDL